MKSETFYYDGMKCLRETLLEESNGATVRSKFDHRGRVEEVELMNTAAGPIKRTLYQCEPDSVGNCSRRIRLESMGTREQPRPIAICYKNVEYYP